MNVFELKNAVDLEYMTLTDDFEIYGKWFINSNPEIKVSGKLSFSNKKMELSTFEGLVELDDLSGPYTIYGETIFGEHVTLLGINGIYSSIGGKGPQTQIFHPTFFVVGEHFLSADDLKFDKVELNSTNLESILDTTVFTCDITKSSEGFSFVYPDIKEWRISSINATLKTNHRLTSGFSNTENVTMDYTALLELIPDEPQNYNWFMEQLDILLNLFSLFTGREQFLKEISFINEKETPRRFKLFITQNGFNEIPVRKSSDIITLVDTQDHLESSLDMWFKLYNQYQSMYKLYFDTTYHGVYDQWKFLNYTRILEGYHRLKYTESTYCSPEKYESIKNKIQTFIEESITEEDLSQLKNNIKNAITYSYEIPFRKRLLELSKQLDEPLFNLIFDSKTDLKSFVNKVIETRNKMTHPQGEGTTILQGMDLTEANLRLNHLFKILIFTDIGLPTELLIEKL
ncbi:hypothetical protein IEK_02897 [Bacillus toyonensis]|uniref:ApeA N-terminal domain 1-containing protein n=1 Tax=Bacillus toyonensis TaxID=155322 RepID=UPI00027BEB69|nr:HEPN domain-containing protein [Bacillus toyonensis]EJV49187.1 hypothetical protein IEK_02897 [Bacillus toyonensis]